MEVEAMPRTIPNPHPSRALRPLFEMQAEMCKALAHPIRLEILELIGERERSSFDLCELLEIPKANVSQHIKVLKDAGLVLVTPSGTTNVVALTMPGVKTACTMVRSLLEERLESIGRTHQNVKEILNPPMKNGARRKPAARASQQREE